MVIRAHARKLGAVVQIATKLELIVNSIKELKFVLCGDYEMICGIMHSFTMIWFSINMVLG